jgi:cobalt-zinc-cadmium efflux system protein
MAHDHRHSGNAPNYNKTFALGVALNLGYIIIEVIAGLTVHSLALLADAGHNISDVLSLLLAWGASYLSRRAATKRHTYGLRGSSILASLKRDHSVDRNRRNRMGINSALRRTD